MLAPPQSVLLTPPPRGQVGSGPPPLRVLTKSKTLRSSLTFDSGPGQAHEAGGGRRSISRAPREMWCSFRVLHVRGPPSPPALLALFRTPSSPFQVKPRGRPPFAAGMAPPRKAYTLGPFWLAGPRRCALPGGAPPGHWFQSVWAASLLFQPFRSQFCFSFTSWSPSPQHHSLECRRQGHAVQPHFLFFLIKKFLFSISPFQFLNFIPQSPGGALLASPFLIRCPKIVKNGVLGCFWAFWGGCQILIYLNCVLQVIF